MLQTRFGAKNSVRCLEFRGVHFSEVANVLQVWVFKSVTRTLSTLGSVSASRSVRSERFDCTCVSLLITFYDTMDNIIRQFAQCA